jgi:hypothetical protein
VGWKRFRSREREGGIIGGRERKKERDRERDRNRSRDRD